MAVSLWVLFVTVFKDGQDKVWNLSPCPQPELCPGEWRRARLGPLPGEARPCLCLWMRCGVRGASPALILDGEFGEPALP